MRKRYRKRYRTLTAQVVLLEKRGLEIDLQRLDAEVFLRVANYYRFTGFALPFMKTRTKFLPGAKFSAVKAVCEYDKARKIREEDLACWIAARSGALPFRRMVA